MHSTIILHMQQSHYKPSPTADTITVSKPSPYCFSSLRVRMPHIGSWCRRPPEKASSSLASRALTLFPRTLWRRHCCSATFWSSMRCLQWSSCCLGNSRCHGTRAGLLNYMYRYILILFSNTSVYFVYTYMYVVLHSTHLFSHSLFTHTCIPTFSILSYPHSYILHSPFCHTRRFPGLTRGLVAVLLYHDGRRSLVASLRSLIQAREGVAWTLGK